MNEDEHPLGEVPLEPDDGLSLDEEKKKDLTDEEDTESLDDLEDEELEVDKEDLMDDVEEM